MRCKDAFVVMFMVLLAGALLVVKVNASAPDISKCAELARPIWPCPFITPSPTPTP